MAKLRQRGTEIDGRGRFADAAFLVRKRNDSNRRGINGRDQAFDFAELVR